MYKKLDSSPVLITIVTERFIADWKATFLEYEAAGLEILYFSLKKNKN